MKHLIQSLISPLADGYAELYREQRNFATLKKCGKEEFFGLRDFYRCELFDVPMTLSNLFTVEFGHCKLIERNGLEARQTSKEQRKRPRFRLEGPRPCTSFVLAQFSC